MNRIQKARSDIERSYLSAKQATSMPAPETLLSHGPPGLVRRDSLGKDAERLAHFKSYAYIAIRAIAQAVASRPVRLGKVSSPRAARHVPDSDIREVESHEILDLLRDPNPVHTACELFFSTMSSLELCGAAFWWIIDGDERKEIYPLPCSWIRGHSGLYESILVQSPNDAEEFTIPSDNFVRFAYVDPADPLAAKSPLAAAAGAINSDEAIELAQAAAFSNGIMPRHMLVVAKDENGRARHMTGEQKRQLIRSVRQLYAGASKSGGDPLLVGDDVLADVKPLTLKPAEMDFTESAKLVKEKVFLAFGVNAIVVGQIEGANRASSMAAEDHFARYCVNPKLALISAVLTESLIPKLTAEPLKVWLEPIEVRDSELDLQRWNEARKNGDVTRNEYRSAMLGLPATEGAVERSILLSTVGGMTGAVQILQSAGQGFISSDQAAALLALFLEVDESIARRIAGSKAVDSRMQLAAERGCLTFDELREFAGLEPLGAQHGGTMLLGRQSQLEEVFTRNVNRIIGGHVAGAIEQLTPHRNGD